MSGLPTLSPVIPWLKAGFLLVAFFAVAWASATFTRRFLPREAWIAQAVARLTVFALALGAAWALRLDANSLGFRAPTRVVWGPSIAVGLMLGAAATVGILLARSNGLLSVLGGLSALQRLVLVVVAASVVEEILCRGTFQGWALVDGRAPSPNVWLASAVLFGAMHLGLLRLGVDFRSVAILLPFLVGLGFLAAWCRSESGSIYPAVAAHVAFNVGGGLGGILFFVVSGRVPGSTS
jgi:membrane protease YdiL (CAAX protease family)